MKRSGFYSAISAGIVVLAVAVWLFSMVYWLLSDYSARDIRLNSSATELTKLDPDKSLNNRVRQLDNLLRPRNKGRCTRNQKLHSSRSLPAPTPFGESLVWTGYECPDGFSTRFARRVIEDTRTPETRPRHSEVIRIGLNFKRAENLLDQLLTNLTTSLTKSFKNSGIIHQSQRPDCKLPGREENGNRPKGNFSSISFDGEAPVPLSVRPLSVRFIKSGGFPIECGIIYQKRDHYVTITDLEVKASLKNVEQGFGFRISVTLKSSERKTNCTSWLPWGDDSKVVCDKDTTTETEFTWNPMFTLSPKPNENSIIYANVALGEFEVDGLGNFLGLFLGNFQGQVLAWFVEIVDFLHTYGLLGLIGVDMEKDIEDKIERRINNLLSLLIKDVEIYARSITSQSFRTRFRDFFKNIEIEEELPDAVIVKPGVINGGKVIFFSLEIPTDWLGENIKVPDFEQDADAHRIDDNSVSLHISYSLVNSLLDKFLDSRPLSEFLPEQMKKSSDAFNIMEDLLEYGELGFLDPSKYVFPSLRVRPASENETRVFFANMKVLLTKANDDARDDYSPVPIGLTVEGKTMLDRETNDKDVNFLLNHVALEPLVEDDDEEQSRSDVKLSYALTPLYRYFIKNIEAEGNSECNSEGNSEGNSVELEDAALTQVVADLDCRLQKILEMMSLRRIFDDLPPSEVNEGNFTINWSDVNIRNDMKEYALVLSLQIE